MDTLEIFEKCKREFCGTHEAQMMFQYRSRTERLSFEERQAVIRQAESSFAEVFPFLKSEAPSLSESDLLYLALASVGLSNPVIAECLCISKDSVRMRKLRLREKLTSDWYSAVFPEQKRNVAECDESVTANIRKDSEDTITLSQKDYKHLMRKSMKTKMYFPEAVKVCYKKFFTTTGRARRSEFWYFLLYTYIASIVVAALNIPMAIVGVAWGKEPQTAAFIALMCLDAILALAIFLPLLTSCVRRLHDIERSGSWIWLGIAPSLMMAAVPVTIGIIDHNSRGGMFASGSPEMIISLVSFGLFYLLWIVCSLILVIMLAKEGTEGPNRYGPDPITVKE